ncbi:MAG: hypothetical protein ACJ76I_04895 [Gaiellaceae bacterium]
MSADRWWTRTWRLFGGVAVPPLRRVWRRGWGGIDAASIPAPDDPGGGADIARDLGPFDDPFARDEPAGRPRERPDERE